MELKWGRETGADQQPAAKSVLMIRTSDNNRHPCTAAWDRTTVEIVEPKGGAKPIFISQINIHNTCNNTSIANLLHA